MKLELVLDEVDLPWSPDPEWKSGLEALLAATSAADCVLQVVITDDETLQEHNLGLVTDLCNRRDARLTY